MLFTKGSMPVVKIGDFGLSKMLYNQELTMTSIGTLHFTAPEIMLGNPYNYKCDIWSLGVVLYLMLTFRFPFSDNQSSYLQYYQNVMNKDYPPLPETVHPIYHKVMEAVLQKDPSQRVAASVILKIPNVARTLHVIQSDTSDTKEIVTKEE